MIVVVVFYAHRILLTTLKNYFSYRKRLKTKLFAAALNWNMNYRRQFINAYFTTMELKERAAQEVQ